MKNYLAKQAEDPPKTAPSAPANPSEGAKASTAYTPVGALLGGIVGYATAKYVLDMKGWQHQVAGAGIGAAGGGWLGHLAGKASDEDFNTKIKPPPGETDPAVDQARGKAAATRLMFGSGEGKIGWGEAGILAAGTGVGAKYINPIGAVARNIQRSAIARAEGLKTGVSTPGKYLAHGAKDVTDLKGGLSGLFLSDAKAQAIANRSLPQYLDESKKPVTSDFKDLDASLNKIRNTTKKSLKPILDKLDSFSAADPKNKSRATFSQKAQNEITLNAKKMMQDLETIVKSTSPTKSAITATTVGPTVNPIRAVFNANPEGKGFRWGKGGVGGGIGFGLAMLATYLTNKAFDPYGNTAE